MINKETVLELPVLTSIDVQPMKHIEISAGRFSEMNVFKYPLFAQDYYKGIELIIAAQGVFSKEELNIPDLSQPIKNFLSLFKRFPFVKYFECSMVRQEILNDNDTSSVNNHIYINDIIIEKLPFASRNNIIKEISSYLLENGIKNVVSNFASRIENENIAFAYYTMSLSKNANGSVFYRPDSFYKQNVKSVSKILVKPGI